MNIEGALQNAGGRPSGFDYIRIALAVAILYQHSVGQGLGADAQYEDTNLIPNQLSRLFVPMFFAASGFLVAGSLFRTRYLSTFVGLRALRIFPALWTDVLFSALILGPIFTTLPLSQYFTDKEFSTYMLNLIGEPHYFLPGVFKENPTTDANGQLWTIRWELFSYIALTVCAAISLHKNHKLFLGIALLAHIAFPLGVYLGFYKQGPYYAMTVVTCFLVGVYMYINRGAITLKLRAGPKNLDSGLSEVSA